jgi:hypothetical protein
VTEKREQMGPWTLDFPIYVIPSMVKIKRGRLVKMGYVKRDAPSAPRLHAKKKVKKIVMNHD